MRLRPALAALAVALAGPAAATTPAPRATAAPKLAAAPPATARVVPVLHLSLFLIILRKYT